jgi:cell division septum initiation protein DivIVA
MNDHVPSRAGEIAAEQVEAIVLAAQAAADQLQEEAKRQADQIRAQGRRDAQKVLSAAHQQVAELTEKARKQASDLVEDAEKESAQLREQTRRQVEGRVAAAEQAAEEALADARALSNGLKRLGEILGEQGERIVRDVQAAHRRMQANLRVGPPDSDLTSEPPAKRPRTRRPATGGAAPARRSPFEELDVPRWVERS